MEIACSILQAQAVAAGHWCLCFLGGSATDEEKRNKFGSNFLAFYPPSPLPAFNYSDVFLVEGLAFALLLLLPLGAFVYPLDQLRADVIFGRRAAPADTGVNVSVSVR